MKHLYEIATEKDIPIKGELLSRVCYVVANDLAEAVDKIWQRFQVHPISIRRLTEDAAYLSTRYLII